MSANQTDGIIDDLVEGVTNAIAAVEKAIKDEAVDLVLSSTAHMLRELADWIESKK